MKTQKVLFILVLVILQACVPYSDLAKTMPGNTSEEIPLNAYKIIVTNDSTLFDNYTKCYTILVSHDFRIESDNKEMGYILASKKYDDTSVRMNIKCDNNSIAITGEWKLGSKTANTTSYLLSTNITYDWERAQWNKKADFPSATFSKMVQFALDLGDSLMYK
ncbi:MAG: hypothetical protein Q8N38_08565 [Bacteroidales bacterium]|nr:hypothetical protein [Bacteroidales bacterium]